MSLAPDLVGAGRSRGGGHEVGRDGLIVPAVGGLRPEGARHGASQFMLAHEPAHAPPAGPQAFLLQSLQQARAAIGLAALGVSLAKLPAQLGIGPGPGAGWAGFPGVIAAA